MKRIQNLNEEIKRMKSLFGDDRLYGNLVDNFLGESLKNTLIMEQAKPITKLLDAIVNSIKKSGKSKITSDIDGIRTIYTINPDGTILKNGKKIDDLTKITNFLSDELSKRIARQVNQITATEKGLLKYLSKEGYNGISLEKHINDIVDNLYQQKLINEGTLQKFKNNLQSTNIFQSIDEVFSTPESAEKFIKSISSDIDFAKKYPEIHELIDNVPDLKRSFYNSSLFDDGGIISDEYDSFISIVDKLRKYEGKELDDSGEVIGKLIPWNNYFDSSGKLNLEYNGIDKTLTLTNRYGQKLPNDLERSIRNEINKIKEANPNVNITISNNGGIIFSAKNLKPNEVDNLYDVIDDVADIPEKIITKEVPIKTRTIDFGVDEILDDNILSKSKDWYTNYYKQYIRNFIKNSRSGILKFSYNPTLVKMRDVFTTKLSRFLDPSYLRKNGYLATDSKGPNQIDGDWQNVLNSIWKVESPIKGTNVDDIFIKTDEESLLYGLPKGGIKPNLVKNDDWKKSFKNEFLKSYKFLRFGLKGEYRKIATDKLIRNYFLQIGSATTIVELIRNYSYYKLTLVKWWIETQIESGKKFFMEQWQGQDVNPNTMLPLVKKSYEKKCKDNIKNTIISVFGNTGESKFNTYFGSEGELKDITKIKVTPTNFGGEDYNDTDNLPNLESVEYNINAMNLDGKVYKDFGEIKKENDKYFLITIPVDGKINNIPLNCTPDFDTFWVESWKEIYKLKNDEGSMKEKMQEIGEDIDWENLDEGNFLTEIENSIDKITIGTITDGIESGLEKVKDAGEGAEEFIQKKLPDGGTSGGMGEIGEF